MTIYGTEVQSQEDSPVRQLVGSISGLSLPRLAIMLICYTEKAPAKAEDLADRLQTSALAVKRHLSWLEKRGLLRAVSSAGVAGEHEFVQTVIGTRWINEVGDVLQRSSRLARRQEGLAGLRYGELTRRS